MASTLHEPHLLASFTLPSRHVSDRKGKGVAYGERPHVVASSQGLSKSDGGEVALAVQGDGIHIYELSDFHQSFSISTGPSTSFLSPPASTSQLQDGKTTRRTYALVPPADDSTSEPRTSVVRMWSGSSSGTSSASKDVSLSHHATHLIPSQDGDFIFALGGSGEMTVLSQELDIRRKSSPSKTHETLKSFVLSRKVCTFLPGVLPSNAAIVAVFSRYKGQLLMRIDALHGDSSHSVTDQLEIPLSNANDIIDVSFDPSGHASVLGSTGAWISFQVECKNDTITIGPSSNTVWLQKLAFIDKPMAKAQRRVSVLNLASSFVMLASISDSAETVLILVDVQYGVVLHSITVPAPSSISKSHSALSVHLEKGSKSQAVLILSTLPNEENGSQQCSSIFIVPFTVPERSTIANAMACAALDIQWVASSELGVDNMSEESRAKRRLLKRMRAAMEEQKPQDADVAFFRWFKPREDQETANSKLEVHKKDDDKPATEDVVMDDTTEPKPEPEPKPALHKRSAQKTILDHDFISQVLSIVLQDDEPKPQTYSPKICRFLVSKRVVSQSMVKGGLINALAKVDDWETLRECFLNVVDISEVDALGVLRMVMERHGASETSPDKMAVDAPENTTVSTKPATPAPPLRTFFAYVVNYPGTVQAWRLATHKNFPGVVDLLALMAVVEEWLNIYGSKDLQLSLGEVKMNEQGVPVPKFEHNRKLERVKGMLLPPLDKILIFLQAMLDASFIKLVQEPSALALLRRISELIHPHVSINTELEMLRGPLTPFDKARAQAVAAAKEGRKRGTIDWRKRRKQDQEQAALALGPYQVEELIF